MQVQSALGKHLIITILGIGRGGGGGGGGVTFK